MPTTAGSPGEFLQAPCLDTPPSSAQTLVMIHRTAGNHVGTALQRSPGARAYYDATAPAATPITKALRALANRLVGILHG